MCLQVLQLLCVLGAVLARTVRDRSDAFVGYQEVPTDCVDRLTSCKEKAESHACVHDPYVMRHFCPVSCAIPRCSYKADLEQQTFPGYATPEATKEYFEKLGRLSRAHARSLSLPVGQSLMLSSVGVGAHLGDPSRRTDEATATAVIYSVSKGWNVIDTGYSFRGGHAETSVGHALRSLLAPGHTAMGPTESEALAAQRAAYQYMADAAYQYKANAAGIQWGETWNNSRTTPVPGTGKSSKKLQVSRSMLFVSTKIGMLTDGHGTRDPLVQQLLAEGKLADADIAYEMHTIHPAYIEAALDRSLQRLHLETLDTLYLHNPAEMQVSLVGRQVFMNRLQEAFVTLEDLRKAGKIRFYGLSTWRSFRVAPDHSEYLSLAEVALMAESAGGDDHGFRFIQMPVNILMPEAWELKNQHMRTKAQNMSIFEVADLYSIHVVGSNALCQGVFLDELRGRLDPVMALYDLPQTPMKVLQMARSSGVAVALVGHKVQEHALQNLFLSRVAPLGSSEFQEAWPKVQSYIRLLIASNPSLAGRTTSQGVLDRCP